MIDAINSEDVNHTPESLHPSTDSNSAERSVRRSKSNRRDRSETTDVTRFNNKEKSASSPHLVTDGIASKMNDNNIFSDLEALRLSDTANLAGDSEMLSHVPVRKPTRHEYFRVHPDMSLVTSIFVDKGENETFLVAPQMRQALVGETRPVLLAIAVTAQGVVMVFPVYLPTDGRPIPWHETARQAYEQAKTEWVRMASDKPLGAYRIYKAEGKLPAPAWPSQNFNELLEIAFRDRIIEQMDHPVVRRLRGLT